MNSDDITPVILTYNEAPNIGRCLEKLVWAKDIVIVDSFSSDETLAIAGNYPQVRVFKRVFDSHSQQWNFSITLTNIATNWILALDADYILTEDFIQEVNGLSLNDDVVGYSTSFLYRVKGRVLRASLYPPVTVLYRRKSAFYVQDGHTQRVALTGTKLTLKHPILHDDRKSFSRWVASQKKYAAEEAVKLWSAKWVALNWKDRIRKLVIVAAPLIFFYGLFGKGLILDGWPGVVYCWQRLLAEILLSKDLFCNYLGHLSTGGKD